MQQADIFSLSAWVDHTYISSEASWGIEKEMKAKYPHLFAIIMHASANS